MKNYYKILGVLDDAEDIVIRAAYKALAQRYHPDKWKGDPHIANQRMADINEAHATLSDELKRREYDNEYFRFNSRNDAENTANDDSDDVPSEEIEGWEIAIEFFPNIKIQYDELKKISAILANTYRTSILENKSFKEADAIKERFEIDYLTRFYGENEGIRKFAKRLFHKGHAKAAIKLNQIVRVMGNSVDVHLIKKRIYKEFSEANPMEDPFVKDSIAAFTSNKYSAIDLINIIEYEFSTKISSTDFNSNFTLMVEGKLYEKIGISSLHIIAKKAVNEITGLNYS
jgi:curved DNA-binding protein CbpA